MVKLLLLTLAFVAVAIIFLAAKLLLKGDARGPVTHIGASKAMRDLGIGCVESMDRLERFQLANKSHANESRMNKH